ncbi:MAG TPA: NnrS family protein [Acidobacteriota bacterium]|nr:NnrS family protein [Acidobacteriota bacterium]
MATASTSPRLIDSFCRHPYRLMFPLGVALSWGGIAHWALYASGWLADYRPRFHAVAQTQGFMTCLSIGFLFTMIPRLTDTAPPRAWQLQVVVAAPVGVVLAAWYAQWILAQALWLLVVLTAVGFIVQRFDGPGESRKPNGFVWIPAAMLMGVVGAAMTLGAEIAMMPATWMQAGQRMIQQGFFVGLILGVGGSLALPLMTRGEQPASGPVTRRDHLARIAHLGGAIALAASFWIEVSYSLQLAMAIRALVTFGVIAGGARLWRRPLRPGANARIIWVAAWLLPAGYLVAALLPLSYRAGLHISLIGGLAMLGLAVSAQVLLGHGGYTEFVRGWPLSALLLCACMTAALLTRVLMELDPANNFWWMGWAAGLFLMATIAWACYVGRGILRPR